MQSNSCLATRTLAWRHQAQLP
ncbi:hypothetical protein A2U01_0105458, partial [Trifolium medium]|nr:hypothetical protein [Trifolium medium]